MAPGKMYAFCGASGSGKSSILALLQRFYEPTAGCIEIDGIDIRTWDIAELRGIMGYVSQEAVLFEGSIRFNLLVSRCRP
jgi:ATP-binding cassette subfamily B (MDR/TAP) protein 1